MGDPLHRRARRLFNPVTWCIQLYRNIPAPFGGWCPSHVGVWAAVQRPRKVDLEAGGVEVVPREQGFPERNFNYTDALPRAAPSQDAFVEVRQRLFVDRNIGNARGNPFLFVISSMSVLDASVPALLPPLSVRSCTHVLIGPPI